MNWFKKLRFLFRFLTAVVKKQYRMIFLGLILGIFFFIAFPKLLRLLPQTRKTLKVGLIGQYTASELPEEVLQDISYGLTSVSEKGEPEPNICQSWTTVDQGKTYIFKLKATQDVWHDGKPFSPGDINYNFKEVSFSVNGDQMTFNLKEPFSPFPIVLSRPLFKKGLVGLGRYKVKKIERNGKFVKAILLVPADNPGLLEDASRLPNKLYRFYNNEKDLKTGFNLGETDSISGLISPENIFLGKSVKAKPEILRNAYLGVFFDTSKPPFSEKSFRQALAYAVPKETDEKRALSPISPDSWAYNPDVKPYSQDLDHARQLLDKEKKFSEKIKISTFPQYEPIANLVKESWQKIGLESEIQIVTFLPENFDVLIIAREIPKDPDQYFFWHSTQAGNLTKFKSPRVDKLLEDGRKTLSQEERKNIYFDFQRFLAEESPVIFLSHPLTYSLVRE